ncbi:hypothetical protein F4780DRAFT_200516 [Xylariomycetidae sp. FL0641]|nr:hypothetical protein F4780DRAFT_200516 [Xylariomycetidae sp. FL0641]
MKSGQGKDERQWTMADVTKYGWVRTELDDLEFYHDNLEPLYKGLKFNKKSDKGVGVVHQNHWPQGVGGAEENSKAPTMGSYENIFNGANGYLVAANNYNPKEKHQGDVPDLQSWSDFMALLWQDVIGTQNLNYVVRDYVANWNTRMMMYNALKLAGQDTLPEWPGFDFTINDEGDNDLAEAFQGLLGSYHAAGPAYMLLQNQRVFGKRMITKIRIWNMDADWDLSDAADDIKDMEPHMLLYIEPVQV